MKHKVFAFEKIVSEIGDAGVQVTQLGAAEGSAGNISTFVWALDGLGNFHEQGMIDLPAACDCLGGGWLVISGTGRRLRDLGPEPEDNLCVLKLQEDGKRAMLYSAAGVRPTSEFNSHLAIHNDQVGRFGLEISAVVHAQPRYVTLISHLRPYGDTYSLNRRLLRWEPESIIVFPEGIGMIPFHVPGSAEQMEDTLAGLRAHRAVVWQKHGIVTRSNESPRKAADLVEYAETAAHFEYLNLALGSPCEGMSDEEVRQVCRTFNVEQPYF